MFTRKNTRSTHKTAYTGVNPNPTTGVQPNQNAMAAALTIGERLKLSGNSNFHSVQQTAPSNYVYQKQQRDFVFGHSHVIATTSAPAPRRSQSVLRDLVFGINAGNQHNHVTETTSAPASRRSQPVLRRLSLQVPAQPQLRKANSLLKRSLSIVTSKPQQALFSSFGPHTPPSSAHAGADSLDEYSNHDSMHDLKLAHVAPLPPQPKVKMVKKYVPTANGIQVIEVPESTLNQEIARSNSLRLGQNLRRSPSMRMNPPGGQSGLRTGSMRGSASARSPGSRLSSLIESPGVASPAAPAAKERSALDELELEIEREKKKVANLERKKKEFEALKLQRKKLEEQAARDAQASAAADAAEVEIDQEENAALLQAEAEAASRAKIAAEAEAAAERRAKELVEERAQQEAEAYAQAVELAKAEAQVVAHLEAQEKAEEEARAREEAENMFSREHDTSAYGQGANNDIDIDAEVDQFKKEINFVQTPAPIVDEFGIEEIVNSDNESSTFAKHLRPTFNEHPEEVSLDLTPPDINQTLQIPNANNGGSSSSSLRSLVSIDSQGIPKTPLKQPVKSAMKNPSTKTLNGKKSNVSNPAHQAYLSLTTAENTRLNSKLSSSQLNPPAAAAALEPQLSGNKRFSQTVRKTPPQHQQAPQKPLASGLSSRSLRPQSVIESNGRLEQNQISQAKVSMSSRSLRPSTYIEPIKPHPALEPGYQSPSKVRAADLYAKANSRPMSTFAPIQRKSSFSREERAVAQQPQHQQQQQSQPSHQNQALANNRAFKATNRQSSANGKRLTLRDPYSAKPLGHTKIEPVTPKPQPVNPYALRNGTITTLSPQAALNANSQRNDSVIRNGGFSSRLVDSDDESLTTPRSNSKFTSKFADSDDESSLAARHSSTFSSAPAPRNDERIVSLREENNSEKPKRKFGKLRKLFGKS